MNTKLIGAVGVVVVIAAGGLIYDSLEKNRGYVDPSDEPATLPSEFEFTPTGGGEFNVGEPIKAGFTMKYTGSLENGNAEGSRFYADEVTVFASSNNEATSPHGKAIVPVNGTANLAGELMTFDLTGYTCAKEGDVSIVFRNVLTRYDIEGVPQTEARGDRDEFYGGDVYVSLKCVAGAEMMQIDPPTLSIPAGQSPIGWDEANTGYLHDDGNYYYNGEIVDREGNNEGSIIDDIR